MTAQHVAKRSAGLRGLYVVRGFKNNATPGSAALHLGLKSESPLRSSYFELEESLPIAKFRSDAI